MTENNIQGIEEKNLLKSLILSHSYKNSEIVGEIITIYPKYKTKHKQRRKVKYETT